MIISDHVQRAVRRLVEQYRRKVKTEGLVSALVRPFQEIENVLEDLEFDVWLESSTGQLLDDLGTIIGVARGLDEDDAAYRLSLKTKVVENTSQGEPERLIAVFKILTGADLVVLCEGMIASVGLETDGTIGDQDMANAIFARMKGVPAACVRVDQMCEFDPVDSFAFAGNTVAKGFDNEAMPGTGGKFATCYVDTSKKFAFAGNNPYHGGFGAGTDDPLVGGVFI